jgi:lysophospholipase L1-like esterase
MLLTLTLAIISLAAVIIAYPFVKSSRLPKNRPSTYLKEPSTDDARKTVIIAGDSLTHGTIGFGYVEMLSEELDKERFRLINAGVNAHLVWNLSERLEEIIECRPSIITILIGTNDASAATSEKEGKAYVKNSRLPRMPDCAWFEETLQSVVKRLQSETSASIALLSMPTIGEDPNHPAFRLSVHYGRVVKEIAEKTGVRYLPLQEEMGAYLDRNPSSPKYPFESERAQMFLSIFRHYLFGKSWDSIAENSGFRLHTDYLHLNSIGARLVADLIMQFIESTTFS